MTQWQKFLLGTALAVIVSSPLYANQLVGQPSPSAGNEQAGIAEGVLPEAPPEIVQENAQACPQMGALPENTSANISFFYPFPAAKIVKDDAGVRAESEGGVMLVDGAQYTLQYIEFPKQAQLPFSSVLYPMEARFVHKAADGTTAILSVPVKEGSANLGMQMMLENGGATSIDPNDLLPADRTFALMGTSGGCSGEGVEKHYVLTTPVQVSAAQIRKFEQLF